MRYRLSTLHLIVATAAIGLGLLRGILAGPAWYSGVCVLVVAAVYAGIFAIALVRAIDPPARN